MNWREAVIPVALAVLAHAALALLPIPRQRAPAAADNRTIVALAPFVESAAELGDEPELARAGEPGSEPAPRPVPESAKVANDRVDTPATSTVTASKTRRPRTRDPSPAPAPRATEPRLEPDNAGDTLERGPRAPSPLPSLPSAVDALPDFAPHVGFGAGFWPASRRADGRADDRPPGLCRRGQAAHRVAKNSTRRGHAGAARKASR